MKKKKKVSLACFFCGEIYREENLTELDGKKICPVCLSSETICCSYCEQRIWSTNNSKHTFNIIKELHSKQ